VSDVIILGHRIGIIPVDFAERGETMNEQTKYLVASDKQRVIRRTSAMQFALAMTRITAADCPELIANAAAIESYLSTGKAPKTKKGK
jgi:hypothetical protein